MNYSVCLLVALFGGTVAYPVRQGKVLEELRDIIQNAKMEALEKFLENGGGIYPIEVDKKEGNSKNKVIPVTNEHPTPRKDGEKDETGEYSDPSKTNRFRSSDSLKEEKRFMKGAGFGSNVWWL